MSSAASSSTPSSVAMAMLQPTSVAKRLKKDAPMGSAFLEIMTHAFGHGAKLFEYLEEPHLSYTCSLFRTNLLPLIVTRDEELVKRHEKHYEQAVLACGTWHNRPHNRYLSIWLEPALHDMIHMYNADVSIHMVRGTTEQAIASEFVQEWAHVQLFFSYMFKEVEEVTEDMIWCEVVGKWYLNETNLDLVGARSFLVKHTTRFQAEYERIQRTQSALADLTSDEE
jgi:hypothetical protein